MIKGFFIKIKIKLGFYFLAGTSSILLLIWLEATNEVVKVVNISAAAEGVFGIKIKFEFTFSLIP